VNDPTLNTPTPDTSAAEGSQYLRYLPAIYQQGATRDNPNWLGLFLKGFEAILTGTGDPAAPGLEEQFEGIHGELGGIERTFEPGPGSPDGLRTPDEFLDWLAGWVALPLRGDVPPERQRLLIANAVPLYRIRGTKAGLEKLVSLYTTLGCTVVEAGPRFQIGIHSTIGEDTSVNGGPPHYFRVIVRLATTQPAEIAAQRQILTSIIDAEKPAHTYFNLEIVTPILQIGVTSHVGVDTLLDGDQ
jgi:phage tail-like protein